MNIIENLTNNLNDLSSGQKKIALYILRHKELISLFTSQILAQKIGVSQSSIIKFIQFLGFDGFNQFKLQLAVDIVHTNINQKQPLLYNQIANIDSLAIMAKKLVQEKQLALIKTTNNINFDTLTIIIQTILSAQRVQIISIGDSALISKNLAYNLQRLGLIVIAETDPYIQVAMVQSLKKTDLLLAISFSGQDKEINLSADIAKKNGVIVCAITSLQQSSLRSIADHVIDTIVDETDQYHSFISLQTTQSTILDLIFMGVLQTLGHEAEQYIDNSLAAIKQLQNR